MSQARQLLSRFIWPPEHGSRHGLVLAVSGGADSIALLHLTATAIGNSWNKMPLVAHFDHNLHADSLKFAKFVERVTESYGWEFAYATPSSDLKSAPGSLEAAARAARYDFLSKIAAEKGYRFLATGHTADDQAETVLHRICRGAGVRGASGIATQRRLGADLTLLRPLLGCWRRELVEFLESEGLEWCTDPSNETGEFTRNRIRNDILPLLESTVHPDAKKSLWRFAGHAAEAFEVVAAAATELIENALVWTDSGGELDRSVCSLQPRIVVQTALAQIWTDQNWPQQAMSTDVWERLVDAATTTKNVNLALPGGLSAVGRGNTLKISL
jgi:tRNA(Ile)-lysidine synthase